jgi:hypothetical protein
MEMTDVDDESIISHVSFSFSSEPVGFFLSVFLACVGVIGWRILRFAHPIPAYALPCVPCGDIPVRMWCAAGRYAEFFFVAPGNKEEYYKDNMVWQVRHQRIFWRN